MDIQMDNREAIRRIEDHMRIHELNEPRAVLVNVALDKAIQALRDQRPEGTWTKTGQSFVNPNKFRNFCCSNCLCELDEHIRIEPNFCPNCGADMRPKGD